MDAAIDLVKPGVSTDQIAAVWPKAEEFGFQDEMDAFGLQFGHGVGVSLHERPIITRLNSFVDPLEIKEGMLFALETYCPGRGRAVGGADRGGGRRHRGRLPRDHVVPV